MGVIGAEIATPNAGRWKERGAMVVAGVRVHLLILLLVGFAVLVTGLKLSLPLLPEADEGTFVGAAMQIATTGDLNPGFFGHPGATTIYPLAVAIRLWMFLFPGQDFVITAWQAHYFGRLISVAYTLLAGVVTVRIGLLVWNARVALAAGWFLALSPLVVFYSKLLRTDTAATFWGVLALWLALRLLAQSSLRRQVAAGAAVGLSIASRYFLAATGLALAAIDLILVLRADKRERTARFWWRIIAGLVAVPMLFLIANPAMPLHWQQVLHDLTSEARVEHLGADGFTPLGNFGYYLSVALPVAIGWPLTLLAGCGALLAIVRGDIKSRILLGWVVVFLLLISTPSLHWDRWIIPALPILALFAAAALDWIARWIADRTPRMQMGGVFAVLAFIALLLPLWRTALYDVSLLGQNTRLAARGWIVHNLPAGSVILQETYGAPLEGASFESREIGDLFRFDAEQNNGAGWQQLDEGADYVVASSYIYGRYFNEPHRYAEAIDFYEQLFSDGNLIAEFAPAWYANGPVLRIYRLSAPQDGAGVP